MLGFYCFQITTGLTVSKLFRPGARIAWLGGKINFGGHEKFIYVWIRDEHEGTRNLFQCGSNEKGEDQKKKRSASQKFYEILCESTKISKICAVNTNLGVLVAPSLLIFSGHSPRLGGTIFVWGGTSSHLGGYGPGMPPRGAGSKTFKPKITSNILFYVLTLLRAWQHQISHNKGHWNSQKSSTNEILITKNK